MNTIQHPPLMTRNFIIQLFSFITVASLLLSCASRRSLFYNSAKQDYIKLDKKADSLLIIYSNKRKITYCEALKYLANTTADLQLHEYFYGNDNSNFQRYVRYMNYKTYICPRWVIDFGGPHYPDRKTFYGDVYNWMLFCECEYNDSTKFEVMFRSD